MAATDGATGRSGDTAERCPVPVRAASAPRPWPERQPHVLWEKLFDSDHFTAMDATKCMLVCRLWRQCIAHSTVVRRRIGEYQALRLVFDSGYVTQGDAYNCMRVCRQWDDCVHAAAKLWHSIVFRPSRSDPFANWSDAIASAIAAKRADEIAFRHTSPTRHQVSAILERNAQLRRLALYHVPLGPVRALDSLQAPLTSLRVASRCALNDSAFAEIVASAPVLKQLRELYVCAALGDATVQLIAAQFTQLNVLHLNQCYGDLTPAALGHLCADGAHTRTTLRVLELCRGCFWHRDAATQHILSMPNLAKLFVHGAGEQWRAELARAYKQRHSRELQVVWFLTSEPALMMNAADLKYFPRQ